MIWSPRRREGEPPLGWWRAAGVTALLACLYFIAPFGQETDPLPLAWAGALALLVVAGLPLLAQCRTMMNYDRGETSWRLRTERSGH